MYIRRNLPASVILWFCAKHLAVFILLSSIVFFMYQMLDWKWVGIPFLPVGTIGTAVAFYVGFKNNSSYERLWEARKIWGSITNNCRSFGMLVSSTSLIEKDMIRSLLERQIAWCNVLRFQLRSVSNRWSPGWVPREVELVMKKNGLPAAGTESVEFYTERLLNEADRESVKGKSNLASEIMRLQVRDITALEESETLPEFECDRLQKILISCVDMQGASERIKNFPFPRQYAHFSSVFVWIFVCLLPFSLIHELGKNSHELTWLVIPCSTLISWIFLTMEQVGDTSEDPFENGINDVPLTAICRNIEIELLEMLGETNLPEKIKPIEDILM